MAQRLTFPSVRPSATSIESHRPPLLWRFLNYGGQLLCGVRGHQMVLHFERDRLSLQCLSCGHHTYGWILDVRPQFRTTRARVIAHPSWTHSNRVAA